jgi:hypothetical protein
MDQAQSYPIKRVGRRMNKSKREEVLEKEKGLDTQCKIESSLRK